MPNASKPPRDHARGTLREPTHFPGHHHLGGTSSRGGKIYLRDIIDLDATHAGADAEGMPAPMIGPDDPSIVGAAVPAESGRLSQMEAPTIALATQVKPADERAAAEDVAGNGTIDENDLDDEDDGENWLSVAAIEAELKPKIIEAFDNIAGTYKRLRRVQDRDVQSQLASVSASPAFGGFGRLLREGTHRAQHSVPLV